MKKIYSVATEAYWAKIQQIDSRKNNIFNINGSSFKKSIKESDLEILNLANFENAKLENSLALYHIKAQSHRSSFYVNIQVQNSKLFHILNMDLKGKELLLISKYVYWLPIPILYIRIEKSSAMLNKISFYKSGTEE